MKAREDDNRLPTSGEKALPATPAEGVSTGRTANQPDYRDDMTENETRDEALRWLRKR